MPLGSPTLQSHFCGVAQPALSLSFPLVMLLQAHQAMAVSLASVLCLSFPCCKDRAQLWLFELYSSALLARQFLQL